MVVSALTIQTVLDAFLRFISIYTVLLIIRVILTWFPTIDWYRQPFALLSQLTDPFLGIFRSFIPPLGGFDLSPMVAILALQFLQSALSRAIGYTAYLVNSYG